uniref:Putative pathogenicity island effector protein n=1 Tax=Arsenophonus nasoniae TaxID=638 RepID=D2U0N5_9GAMM|nr:putative pathogenicity island effector protein [Arsenophonus nasoniae]
MMMLTEMLKKLRNTLQEFNQKQQELGWNIQVASMDKKREGIDNANSAAKWSAWGQIAAGVVGLAGIGAGKYLGSAQIGGQFGNSLGQSTQGITQTIG